MKETFIHLTSINGLSPEMGNWDKLQSIDISNTETATEYDVLQTIPNIFWNWKDLIQYSGNNVGSYVDLPISACHIYFNTQMLWETSEQLSHHFGQSWYFADNEIPNLCNTIVEGEISYTEWYERNKDLILYNIENNLNTSDYNIPYGSKMTWDGVDEKALVTNLITGYDMNNVLIDISFTSVDDGTLDDNSGKEIKGIFIGDYSIKYTKNTLEPEANDAVNQVTLSDNVKRKAY
tara:strand:- start:826 stop:1530 length:705 start_codon:yes stop_codon:yes gene_type:complete